MILIALAVLGLCMGSFVNALVWRLYKQSSGGSKSHKRYSIVSGRSMCTHCHHELAAKDLMPVISWLMLRGRCRYCHQKIEDTPIVELVTALLFIASYLWWPLSFNSVGIFNFVIWLVYLTAFVALAVYDLRWLILPDKIVFPIIGLAVFQLIINATVFGIGWQAIVHAGWGVLFSAGIFFLMFEASKGKWIGFGDVKLAIALGLLVGGPLKALLLIFMASLLGTIIALPMLIKGRAKSTSQIPFGPYLLTSAIIVVLFGNTITNWYSNLFYLR